MKHGKAIPVFLVILLLVVASCFLLIPNSRQITFRFPSGNLEESALVSSDDIIVPPSEGTREFEAVPDEPPDPTPSPLPLTDFYTDLRDELPGHYELFSISTPGNEFSDDLIARLQQLGFPMMLELYADGSAVLGIFDQAILLHYDWDRLLFSVGSAMLPFFYHDGELRVWEGDSYMLFQNPLYTAA